MSLDRSRSYFHGAIDRDEAVKRLQGVNQDGAFLLRTSKTQAGSYTISVQCGKQINHIRISNTSKGGFSLGNNKTEYKTVWDLIESQLGQDLKSKGQNSADVGVSLKIPVANENDVLSQESSGSGELTEQEIAIKIMNGELPPDYEPGQSNKALTEEELMQKIMDGEIDPDAATNVAVSKSAWRKQKGAGTKADARTAQAILDGHMPDDMDDHNDPDNTAMNDDMMAAILDGADPDDI